MAKHQKGVVHHGAAPFIFEAGRFVHDPIVF
jgi:hypothetical protein